MTHSHDELTDRSSATKTVLAFRDRVLADRPVEDVPLQTASGRILAESISAPVDIPDRDYATMDGFAFDASDDYPLKVVDTEVYPESEPPTIKPGMAVRIATGAPLPERANAVLKREEATVTDDELTGTSISPGTYVYEQASNVTGGETLFEAGEVLGAKDAVLLRDLGYETVTVRKRFSVGILATGSEIYEGRTADLDSPMLANLVEGWGHEPTLEGAVPDDYDRVEADIAALADRHDVVMTTGGTSVGNADHVVAALRSLGEVQFHRIRLRPGKPIAVAYLPDHDTVAFAIPGKPVGAYAVTTLVVRPFFTGSVVLSTVPATMARSVDIAPPDFEYAVPVVLEDGTAMPLGHADSALSLYDRQYDPSVLSSSTRATRADGFVLTEDNLEADETVNVVPLRTLECR